MIRHRKVLVVAGRLLGRFVLVAGSIVIASTAAAASAPATPPSAIESLAIRNAEDAGWVHEVTYASGEGHTFSMDNDIGTSQGRQIIVSDGAHARVLVIGGLAYLYGDDKAVAKYFELSSTDPQRYANHWLELGPADPDFATVSAAVTLKSDFGQVDMPAPIEEGRPVVIDGHRVQPLTAHIPATSHSPAATATLYVTTTGKVLPFEYRIEAPGIVSTTKWSGWGHGVQLSEPAAEPLNS